MTSELLTTEDSVAALRVAAMDRRQVSGLTHGFYRYPARFSPQFVAEVIDRFSEPGDLVVDPFMGGGTTLVEALVRGRRVIGNDINSLAVFVARVKTTPLRKSEKAAIREWAKQAEALTYVSGRALPPTFSDPRLANMTLPRARYIKKYISLVLAAAEQLPTNSAREFARCAVLRTGQLALDGKSRSTSLAEFRTALVASVADMLCAIDAFARGNTTRIGKTDISKRRTLVLGDAGKLYKHRKFRVDGARAKLIVTSPPYPGVHVLYHRWQVDGRKETPAPYWIAQCADGDGASYYTFGHRHEKELTTYFETSLRILHVLKKLMAPDGTLVQMIAFSDPTTQLPRYLKNLEIAGFVEGLPGRRANSSTVWRIWRSVPNRRWHATLKGRTSSSREVVLIHSLR